MLPISTVETVSMFPHYKELKERYKNPHAWKLADVKPVEDVWYYDHPNGAVIWVKDVSPIDEMQDERIRYGY